MRICFLSSIHPPLDKRVFDKEATSLAKHGFDVIHIAPEYDRSGQWEQAGVKIITYEKTSGLVGRVLQLPRLYKLGIKSNADVYHCNEVDSWLVGVVIGILHRKRVVFDVHEHYPSMFAESRFPAWAHGTVAAIVRLLYRALAPFTDWFVFAKQSVAVDFKRMKQPQVTVQNFAAVRYGAMTRQHTDQDAVELIHLGLIGRERGWPQLLEAMVLAKNQTIRLRIVGTFSDGSQGAFERRVEELGLNDRVTIENWLPFGEAYNRLVNSDVGLVLFQPGIQNNAWALPHKMFDYMLAGLPVVVPAFAEEVAGIVVNADCGVLIDPSQPTDISRVLDALSSDSTERSRLGANGRTAVLRQYNWEAEADKLVSMYSHLQQQLSNGGTAL